MSASSRSKQVAALGLLVVGVGLDTLGIVLRPAGGSRFVLLGAGLALLLVALLWLARLARDQYR
jgi:hypothetical protein